MRSHLSIICLVMVFAATCCVCFGQATSDSASSQPSPSTPQVIMPGTAAAQPSPNAGAGPCCATDALCPAPAPIVGCPSVILTVDNGYVYLLAGNVLYRYAKDALTTCGTTVPCCPPTTCATVPCGKCNACMAGQPCTNPCTAPANACVPAGAGPCLPAPICPPINMNTTAMTMDDNSVYVLHGNVLYRYPKSSLGTCGTSVPNYPCQAVSLCGCPGNICPPIGAGPCTITPNLTVSPQVQATLDCLNKLCGCDLDKAYLLAMLQIQPNVIAVSQIGTQYACGTSMQDFAINSVSDANSITQEFTGWLRTKFCMNVTACVPNLSPAFSICNLKSPTCDEFNTAYRNEIIQYYVDEIALSQVYLCRGKDCEILKAARKIVENDQERIKELTQTRCGSCKL